ncbi:hypothetical protein HZA45_02690 [Candidatus Peregrinibacteria bacterium]|nr:hypothetical protein [Candidatus Peregrinibacteria bacterium]
MSDRFERGSLAISDEEMLEARGSFPADYMDGLLHVDLQDGSDEILMLDVARDMAEFAMEPFKIVDVEAASRNDIDRAIDVLFRADQIGHKEARLAFAVSLRENCAMHLNDRFEDVRHLALLVLTEKVQLNGPQYF